MNRRKQKSILRTSKLWLLYFNQLLSLAENTFIFKNLPSTIDVEYLNDTLVKKGSIAFYYEEDIDEIVALPYTVLSKNIYGKPLQIQCITSSGVKSRILSKGDFVIMYDNTSLRSILYDIKEYADRLTAIVRTRDVNLNQQKTPRIIQAPEDKTLSVLNAFEQVDNYDEFVYGYQNMDIEGISVTLQPAPYLIDKLDEHFNNVWAEAMRFIGISQLSYQKKERMIRDEVEKTQGGNIASRYWRFTPRQMAVENINKLFSKYLDADVVVEYYDTLPSTDETEEVSDIE